MIMWTADLESFFSVYCPDCDPTNASLWITRGDSTGLQLIASGIDITSTLELLWTVDVDLEASSSSQSWVFRFMPNSTEDGQQVSSPQFSIIDADLSISTTSVSSQTVTNGDSSATTTSSASMTSSSGEFTTQTTQTKTTNGGSSSSSPTSSKTSSSSSPTSNIVTAGSDVVSDTVKKLSTAAIAGIAAGGGVILSGLFALAWCCIRRRRSKNKSTGAGQMESPYLLQDDPHQFRSHKTLLRASPNEVDRPEVASESTRHRVQSPADPMLYQRNAVKPTSEPVGTHGVGRNPRYSEIDRDIDRAIGALRNLPPSQSEL